MKKRSYFLIALLLSVRLLFAQDSELLTKLKETLPGVEIAQAVNESGFSESYILKIPQPVDHKRPEGPSFFQEVFLSHVSFTSPVVLVTEGYEAYYVSDPKYREELSKMLNANQIVVEHRFFGESKPATLDWQYLTVEQEADDLHHIRELFQKIYAGKWLSTGISKGGQTCLSYRSFFPNDVDATVAYVAPLSTSQNDKRIEHFLDNAGEKSCRKNIRRFQEQLLKNKPQLMAPFLSYCSERELRFTMDPEIAFDYMVLDYPFSFWQLCGNCDSIPGEEAGNDLCLANLLKTVSPYYYAQEGMEDLSPFYYQAYTELGYYEYDEKPFRDYLKQKDYPNSAFAPQGVTMKYSSETLEKVVHYLQTEGNHIVYIYGGLDPWSSTGIELKGKTDALKFVKPDGCHRTRIHDLTIEQQEQIKNTLLEWIK